MEEEIIIKKDGELVKGSKITCEGTKPYIVSENENLAKVIDLQTFNNSTKIEIKKYSSAIDDAIKTNENYIAVAIKYLQNCQNKADLNRMLNILLLDDKNKGSYCIKVIKNASLTNEDLVLSMLIKKILRLHYYNLLSSLTPEEIVSLEIAKVNKTPIVELFNIVNNNCYSDLAKESGIYDLAIKIFADTIDVVYAEKSIHLCWENCKNATVTNCPRMRDGMYAEIAKYPFITDGFQIKKKNKTEKLVITKCTKYEFAPNPTFDRKSIAELRNLQTQMMINYFDTETLAEAVQLQENLMTRGQLVPYRIVEKDSLKR